MEGAEVTQCCKVIQAHVFAKACIAVFDYSGHLCTGKFAVDHLIVRFAGTVLLIDQSLKGQRAGFAEQSGGMIAISDFLGQDTRQVTDVFINDPMLGMQFHAWGRAGLNGQGDNMGMEIPFGLVKLAGWNKPDCASGIFCGFPGTILPVIGRSGCAQVHCDVVDIQDVFRKGAATEHIILYKQS